MLTREDAAEIKRLAALYAGAPYNAHFSFDYIEAQQALHAFIDSLVSSSKKRVVAYGLVSEDRGVCVTTTSSYVAAFWREAGMKVMPLVDGGDHET